MLEKNEETVTAPKRKGWFNVRKLFSGIQGNSTNGKEGVSQERPPLPDYLRPAVITAMNQKGGCGKTTTIVNLSAALAKRGYRVLVVDMDPQAHASLGLGIAIEEFRKSIYELMLDEHTTFGDVMRSTAARGLDVIPSSMRLAAAQIELANLPRGETALKRCLKNVEEHYDFILVDCPPTLNMLTLNALVYAKRVLIPVQTHYYALEGMKELFRTVDAVRKRFNPELEILGILATLFDKRMTIAVEMLHALQGHFGSQMFQTVIHLNVKLIEAPMAREPVITFAPHSSAASNYHELAAEVLKVVTKEN